jgi:hypothetical protein
MILAFTWKVTFLQRRPFVDFGGKKGNWLMSERAQCLQALKCLASARRRLLRRFMDSVKSNCMQHRRRRGFRRRNDITEGERSLFIRTGFHDLHRQKAPLMMPDRHWERWNVDQLPFFVSKVDKNAFSEPCCRKKVTLP